MSMGKYTWDQASKICGENAELAEIKTEEVFNAVKEYTLKGFTGYSISFWLNQRFDYTDKTTKYSDGSSVEKAAVENMWYKGQPCMWSKRETLAVLFRPRVTKYQGFMASSKNARKNALCMKIVSN